MQVSEISVKGGGSATISVLNFVICRNILFVTYFFYKILFFVLIWEKGGGEVKPVTEVFVSRHNSFNWRDALPIAGNGRPGLLDVPELKDGDAEVLLADFSLGVSTVVLAAKPSDVSNNLTSFLGLKSKKEGGEPWVCSFFWFLWLWGFLSTFLSVTSHNATAINACYTFGKHGKHVINACYTFGKHEKHVINACYTFGKHGKHVINACYTFGKHVTSTL